MTNFIMSIEYIYLCFLGFTQLQTCIMDIMDENNKCVPYLDLDKIKFILRALNWNGENCCLFID